jgi:rod shape-determining protein MreC
VPRQRTARISRLGALPRPGAERSSPRTKSVTARRLVAFLLVLASLILLTVYLRESDDGALHGAQRLGQSALHPFVVAGERVARPFQDAYGWFAELVDVKGERDRLQARVQELQQRVVQNENAVQENARLRRLLGFVDAPRLTDYERIVTRVIAQPSGPFEQTILVAAGSSNGVKVDSPVVTPDGLVGLVTQVSSNAAQVTLLTDESVRVSAKDAETEASGVLRRASGGGSTLVLDRVDKDLVVREGDLIVTSGWKVGDLESLYPQGIPIGRVTSVGLQDIDLYQRIQVEPFVNFDALSEVVVLRKR